MAQTTTMTSVLVVDDHQVFSEALELLLRRQPDVRLVGSARGAAEAFGMLEDEPDVVLMDLYMPGVDGIEATRRIREIAPNTKVVLLTAVQRPEVIADALAAGACGYVPKTRAADELMDVIRRAAAGELVMPEDDLGPVVEHLQGGRRASDAQALLSLTPREVEVLGALALGSTPGDIASQLGISSMTVQSHVKNILAKLGVHTRIEAVTLAWRHGLTRTAGAA
ncbi:MAG TPA: response regulator transcription factor [Actinomycetota bacterium]|nr:response regulator transcription factor [Actinomycetota bacterium]